MVAIQGYGTYLPLYRIERTTIADQHGGHAGGGETSVPAHDEDVVTLAVNAVDTAVAHAGADAVDAVFAASTSDPFDERGIAPHVATAIGADAGARVADFQGSARAATNAVLSARDAIAAGSVSQAVVVATDILDAAAGSREEQTAGAGAGALVLGETGDVATVASAGAASTGFVGRFKRTGETPQSGDARFNRERYIEAVTAAIDRLDGSLTTEVERAVAPAPDDRWGDRALGAADLEVERHSAFDAVGYAGAASTLIDTALALEEASPEDSVLVVSYGPGGSDALVVTTGAGVETLPDMTTHEYIESKEYVTYGKHREYRETARGDV